MQKDILTCIKGNGIDVINVDFPHMCVNLLQLDISLPIILNEHNIEWRVYQQIAQSKSGFVKLAYSVDSHRLRRYEQKIFKELNICKVSFVSDKDMEEMIADDGIERSKCELIPVGADVKKLDVQELNESAEEKQSKYNIIFVGKMSYGPNVEAVIWFARTIFPMIQQKISDCRFFIVGKEPTEEVRKLANESIIVTGSVDSVEPYYNLANLVVIPLRNGGGVKVKLLEAVSYNKPIVSTSVGVEGTLYSDGSMIPIADHETDFATKCCLALQSDDCVQGCAYSFFLKNYTWEAVGKKYKQMLESVYEECEYII
jgi:glycosyltransferase involved in cell wall biosynthesis